LQGFLVAGENYKINTRILSDKIWNQKPHAKDWLIFPENLGKRLSIDETALPMANSILF
jgi:hypothetical protein